MNSSIRIIGGLYRGKKIKVPDAIGLRPTSNRIRETLFNWLMHDIRQAKCLDAFAGTGALGFEAFSRGASQVTFLEKSDIAQKHLKQTIKQLPSALASLRLIKQDAFHYLNQSSESFDVIFLDPPFDQPDALSACFEILNNNTTILSKNGLIYAESSQAIEPNPQAYQTLHHKKAGQVFFGLFSKSHHNQR